MKNVHIVGSAIIGILYRIMLMCYSKSVKRAQSISYMKYIFRKCYLVMVYLVYIMFKNNIICMLKRDGLIFNCTFAINSIYFYGLPSFYYALLAIFIWPQSSSAPETFTALKSEPSLRVFCSNENWQSFRLNRIQYSFTSNRTLYAVK